jgi:leucyl-tRNA synthetase
MMQEEYQPYLIEPEIQKFWQEHQCFKVTEDLNKEKFYCLSMFPYPSGTLHVGHVRNYVLGDVIARYQHMLEKNVLHPIGWDAFGLPAENAALQQGIAPAAWTYANIDHMRTQFKQLGLSYDWSREITTCKPDYYHWEQWLFIQLLKKGLAYKKNSLVNWDPVDQTVLANEQVINGRGWRSGALIERKEIPQWFFKITAYAEELLNGLATLEAWPDEVKTMQRHWIGRSEGLVISFSINDPQFTAIEIFTTRPDTLFGATFLAISPQHPFARYAAECNSSVQKFLAAYEHIHIPVAEAATAVLEKQGVDSGITAVHPLTRELLPIWIANFVKVDYGCGAIMGVPAHDARDFEFAKKYQLPFKRVIESVEKTHDDTQGPVTQFGQLLNSGPFTGLSSEQGATAIAELLISDKLATRKIHYRLRDWGVSRQRYWGTPIPIIYCDHCGAVPVPEKDLPVILPEAVHFTGVNSPLKTMPEFYQTSCPYCRQAAIRETDTLDTFVESSWYYARFACPTQNKVMLDDRAKYWTPVDHYVGGIEHAVLHLLYARFFHKVLRDLQLVNSNEPFTRLLTQGMVLKEGAKMSKSKGNTVDPEALIRKYGCDTLRLFVLFAAPPEQSLEWSDSGVEGAYRFLKRLWTFAYLHSTWLSELNESCDTTLAQTIDWTHSPTEQRHLRRHIHEILQQAKQDYERQQFNTVIAACMKLLNLLQTAAQALNPATESSNISLKRIIQQGLSILLRLLAPIVPHITHSLWQALKFRGLILKARWPKVAADALTTEEIVWVVQINGKLRAHLSLATHANEEVIKAAALNNPHIKRYTENQTIKKVIIVPKKLINIVI